MVFITKINANVNFFNSNIKIILYHIKYLFVVCLYIDSGILLLYLIATRMEYGRKKTETIFVKIFNFKTPIDKTGIL